MRTGLGAVLVVGLVLLMIQFGGCSQVEPVDHAEADDAMDAPAEQSADEPPPADDRLLDYYEALREVRDLLRESPDHLPARAAALVAAGNIDDIHAFVRDEIALTPSAHGVFTNLSTQVRWGERGALRSGQGTFREKADLLAWMIESTGLEAQVVEATMVGRDALAVEVWAAFFRQVEHEPSLGISDQQAHRLAGRLSDENSPDWITQPTLPPGPDPAEWLAIQANELAATLLTQGGQPDSVTAYHVRGSRFPVVRVTIDGEHRHLNPVFDDTALDGNLRYFGPAGAAAGLLEIETELQVLVSGAAPQWQTVAEGAWTAADLVGRQIRIGATAAPSIPAMTQMRFADVDVLVPYLAVTGSDVDEELSIAHSVVGDPVSLGGDLVDYDEETGLLRRGASRIGLSEDVDPSRVTRIEVAADGRRYPHVDLRVDLLDDNGRSLSGFGGSHFIIHDEGEPVVGRVVQNLGPRPRVLFLLDTSTSVPAQFRGEPMLDVAVELAEEVLEDFPQADVGIVRVDGQTYQRRMTAGNVWTQDLHVLRERGQEVISRSGGSPLWASLAWASKLGPTVIVYINDGEDYSQDRETARELVGMGAPALVVGVGPVVEEELQAMADLSGGEYIEAMEADEIAPHLMRYLQDVEGYPYRLQYQASEAGTAPGEREVTVAIVDAPAPTGQATYEAPGSPGASPGLAGLRLNLTVGHQTVSRVLAGTGELDEARVPTERMRNDVLSTLLSSTIVSFEGDTPPLSVWMDDHVQALLTQETFVTQALAGNVPEALSAMAEGFENLPATPFVANGRLPGATSADARTFVQGMRVSILRERVDMETGLKRTSFDILPTAQFATMRRAALDGHDDGTTDYEVTLQRTAWLAMLEAGAFGALEEPVIEGPRGLATWNLLHDRELAHQSARASHRIRDVFDEVRPEHQHQWGRLMEQWPRDWHLFVPTEQEPMAMWVVHRDTGELYGILADGTGGGDAHKRVTEILDLIQRQFNLISMYTMPLSLHPSISIVTVYFGRLAQVWGAATVAVATMDIGHMDEALARAIAGFACDTLLVIALAMPPLKIAGDVATIINGLLAPLMSMPSSVPTPCSFF